ncbi:hypothetical protein GGX14DRAFT_406141 [Mycena pura]|uniref:Uncharacterized protein n=1 Tax=Mycena pura TaxID=153505 RepID=A0AAD6UR17_9AGAR|nr:hypothetical protein GGX14DRAFT_406141 [Mycena pura]
MTLVMAWICAMVMPALKNAPTCKIQPGLLPAEFKYLDKWPFSHILPMAAQITSGLAWICAMVMSALKNAPTCKIQPGLHPAEFKYLDQWPFSHISPMAAQMTLILDPKAHGASDDFGDGLNLFKELVL